MLTRPQFDAACTALISKYSNLKDDSPAVHALQDWSWNEHRKISGFGFMSRTVIYTRRSKTASTDDLCVDEFEEAFPDDDDANLSTPSIPEISILQQYVVLSATFCVPTFYFSLHDSTGCPLGLGDILKSPLFRHFVLEGTEVTAFGITRPESSFPLISQGDHPTLGTPCWYLHPCGTSECVEEVMSEVDRTGWTEELRLVRWLEAWFMAVGSALNFRL
ncbi:hypothetical protein BDZ94DRAFT_1317663 [Collybia nuda]|uniref:Ubiquitin-like-conjugating enzyme ATG10 n=1 Tax=Collybia nuda TaxID=64659 RepID=A0A9P5YI85_9AGAR|nr:hypothetical protein BDZ94DRAFT_1317663 [Collybia nuda]